MIYELAINISIREQGNYSQGLTVQETAHVTAENFLECAKIMGMFHDLAETLKRDHKPRL